MVRETVYVAYVNGHEAGRGTLQEARHALIEYATWLLGRCHEAADDVHAMMGTLPNSEEYTTTLHTESNTARLVIVKEGT